MPHRRFRLYATDTLCPNCFTGKVLQVSPTRARCPTCRQTFLKAEQSNTLKFTEPYVEAVF